MKNPKAPNGLSAAMKAWWRDVCDTYAGLDSHGLKQLETACRAWDRAAQAAAMLKADGIVYRDRYDNPRPHPCIRIENDARILFLRSVRELGLDSADVEPGRSPAVNLRRA